MTPDLSYLAKTQDLDLTGYIKFYMMGQHAGWMQSPHANTLVENIPNIFINVTVGVALSPEYDTTFESRSEALARGRAVLVNEGFQPLAEHGEYQPVSLTSEPLQAIAKRERHTTFFGVPFFGVHMNVYCIIDGKPHMWLGIRAAHKKSYPGCFDQLAAGGVAYGDNYTTAIIKEGMEEANLNDKQLSNIQFIKLLEQQNTSVYNKPFMGYVGIYDLEVSADFKPSSNDGEAISFVCFSPDELLSALDNGQKWKIDAAAVAADFAIRHNLLTLPPDDLARIQSYLSRPLPLERP